MLLLFLTLLLLLLLLLPPAGEMFATIEKALDERTIGHNPERLNMMKVRRQRVRPAWLYSPIQNQAP